MDYIYRFRSTHALLDGYSELEKQEIFFASPVMLNDPMEGFKDIVWSGDEVLWANFLKHYLLCLLRTVLVLHLNGSDYVFPEDKSFVFSAEDQLPTESLRGRYRSICKAFLEHPRASGLPALLSSRRVIRRNELRSYLRSIHPLALNIVLNEFENAGFIAPRTQGGKLQEMADSPDPLEPMIRGFNALEQAHPGKPDLIDALSDSAASIQNQIDLMLEVGRNDDSSRAGWRTVSIDFPKLHVNHLEQLLYNDWYTACFVPEPTHAAMWGTYGHEHKGVCLKFKTTILPNNAPAITLNRVIGVQSDHERGSRLVRRDAAVELRKVEYQSKFVEIDFFRSLGRLTRSMLEFWAYGSDGKPSERMVDLLSESETWRAQYWKDFVTAYSTKTGDWAHENEYRAVIHSSIVDLSDSEARKVRYNFSDLQGIIFGVKTPLSERAKIIKIVKEKCQHEGRKNFEFMEAGYSYSTGKMRALPLGLIKLDE